MPTVLLLDYSMLLKARHDELVHEWITLNKHELIQRLKSIMRLWFKNKKGKFFSPSRSELRPPGTESHCATLKLRSPHSSAFQMPANIRQLKHELYCWQLVHLNSRQKLLFGPSAMQPVTRIIILSAIQMGILIILLLLHDLIFSFNIPDFSSC